VKKLILLLFEGPERILSSFHLMGLGITFFLSVSLNAYCTYIFEPVKDVLTSFLLTFPLTVGLLIVFLILLNLNWSKLTFIKLLIAPTLFALLFVFLNQVSDSFHLREKGLKLDDEKKEHVVENKQALPPAYKFTPGTVVMPAGNDSITLTKKINFDDLLKTEKQVDHWYYHIPLLSKPVAMLIAIFKDFYHTCKPGRFWGGVFLAFVFAYYIQRYVVSKLKLRKKNTDSLTSP
jgi:hypothetical protein